MSAHPRSRGVGQSGVRIMRGSPFVLRLAGYGLRTPKSPVLGSDVAGVVDALGKNVTQLRPGDEVFGSSRGAFAEYTSAAADRFRVQTREPDHRASCSSSSRRDDSLAGRS